MGDKPESVPVTGESQLALPVAAIVCIVIGAYVVLVMILLIIRQILMQRGWCKETFQCCGKEGELQCCDCCVTTAETCNCCGNPSVAACLDSICPARRKLDCADIIMCRCCDEGCCGNQDPICDCDCIWNPSNYRTECECQFNFAALCVALTGCLQCVHHNVLQCAWVASLRRCCNRLSSFCSCHYWCSNLQTSCCSSSCNRQKCQGPCCGQESTDGLCQPCTCITPTCKCGTPCPCGTDKTGQACCPCFLCSQQLPLCKCSPCCREAGDPVCQCLPCSRESAESPCRCLSCCRESTEPSCQCQPCRRTNESRCPCLPCHRNPNEPVCQCLPCQGKPGQPRCCPCFEWDCPGCRDRADTCKGHCGKCQCGNQDSQCCGECLTLLSCCICCREVSTCKGCLYQCCCCCCLGTPCPSLSRLLLYLCSCCGLGVLWDMCVECGCSLDQCYGPCCQGQQGSRQCCICINPHYRYNTNAPFAFHLFWCGTCDCTCNCQPECDNINCCCFTIGVKGATTSQPQPTWGYGGQQGWGYPGPSMSGTQGMPWGTGAPGAAGGPSISATTMAPYGNTFMASSLAQYPTPSPQYSPLATTGPPPMSPQCGLCKLNCSCQTPNSINCICFEIQLKGDPLPDMAEEGEEP